ncbi:MAG: helicase associated domain-containing protein [Phycisphaerae bacterium]|nr:helicase associated domain-containing protein [Phycisphaerae bacterium]
MNDAREVAKDTLPSAKSEDKEESRLGVWCDQQRQAYRDDRLSKEQIRLLQSIPDWHW